MSGRIGDWLLVPAAEAPPLPARGGTEWTPVHRTPEAVLWFSAPHDTWRGWPVTSFTTSRFQGWLVGELWPGPVQHPADALERPDQTRHLNGYFVIVAYEPPAQQWHVITSRFGIAHAYRHETTRRMGSHYATVAHGAHRLDWEGLAAFFRMGFFHGQRTYFREVTILPMATHQIFDARLRLYQSHRYWQWRHAPQPHASVQAAAEAFGDVFHAVMNDAAAEGRVGLPISGGLDSRSTVVALTQPSIRPRVEGRVWSYSYGYTDDSIETAISRKIARAARFPFRAFTIRPYLFDRLDQILEWTEGFQDITQCRQAFVRDELRKHTDILIGGLWGDVWLDDMGFQGKTGLSTAHLAELVLGKMSKRGHSWLTQHLVRPHLGNDGADILRHHIAERLKELETIKEIDFRVKAYKTEEWSFRWSIPPIRVFHSATLPKLVFYDTRLTDFFLTIPTEYLSGRRLQVEYIKRFSPVLARIPWQVYGANLYWYRYFNSLLIPLRAWRKGKRILQRRRIIERNWEVQFLASDRERNRLRTHLLEPGIRLHHYVDRAEVEKLVNHFLALPAPDGAIGYTVSMLLTFAAWLEWIGKKRKESERSSSGGT